MSSTEEKCAEIPAFLIPLIDCNVNFSTAGAPKVHPKELVADDTLARTDCNLDHCLACIAMAKVSS
jgi:hypothetical protein